MNVNQTFEHFAMFSLVEEDAINVTVSSNTSCVLVYAHVHGCVVCGCGCGCGCVGVGVFMVSHKSPGC